MRCRTAQALMVASSDGELASRKQRALDRHLTTCPVCRADQAAAEGVLAAVATLDFEAEVPARLEQHVFREVRRIAADEPAERTSRSWRSLLTLGPSVAAGAVAVLALVALREMEPSPTAVPAPHAVATAEPRPKPQPQPQVARRSHIPSEPPADLASQAELFVDLPMLRHLDKLEHFDAIATMQGDDSPAPADEAPATNG